MIDEKRFEDLWERAEGERYGAELAAEYPAWRRRQRRAAGMVAGVALMVAVAAPLALTQSPAGNYEKVFCNRMDKPAQQWVDLADELLMTA